MTWCICSAHINPLCFFSSCSVWSWSAPLSPTGVLSWWSTVENATRTWLTLWEPTPWASNCPPRTSNLAPTSSSRLGSTAPTTSNLCGGHRKGGGRPPPLLLPPPFSLSPARTSPSLLPVFLPVSWMWKQGRFPSLLLHHFLSSLREE